MRKYVTFLAVAFALSLAGTAAAALVPGVYDPGATACPVATYANGVLHLEKNCVSGTNASAGADITGFDGQTFSSASFTLASASQCQGGSPRFNVYTSNGTFFLGCNNVTPTTNADGTVTYTFDATTIAAGGNQVPVPTGTITGVEVLIDEQGTADQSQVTFNGTLQVPAPATTGPTKKADCKKDGWKSFTDPTFRNQGQCVAWVNHHLKHGTDAKEATRGKHGKDGKKDAKPEEHAHEAGAPSHPAEHGKEKGKK
jgi:hypothetical protein